ncbi:hypothetical protein M9458_049028, partial [Cirrhinus mrigala]
MHAGVLVGPGRGEEGTCAAIDELPDPAGPDEDRTEMAAGQDAGPTHLPEEVPRSNDGRMKPLQEAATPRAADPGGEQVRPPDSAPYLDPSLPNTAPPSRNP